MLQSSNNPLVLRQQADLLRAEADAMRQEITRAAEEKERRRIERIDNMIEGILVNITINEGTQLLNTEDQVARLIQDERYVIVANIYVLYPHAFDSSLPYFRDIRAATVLKKC